MQLLRRWGALLRHWVADSAAFLASSPSAAAAVVGALVVGLVAGWVPARIGFDYVWADARFCDDCHVHDYANEAFFRSVHAGLTTCHDCHRVPIRHYPRNLVLTPLSTGEELEHVPHVESVICSACHLEGHEGELTGPMTPALLDSVVKVNGSPLHDLHRQAEQRTPGPGRGEPAPGDTPAHDGDPAHDGGHAPVGGGHGHAAEEGPITCMDCHGSESNRAHRFEATRENCLACHEGISESTGRLKDLACQECHFEGFVGR